MDRPYQMLKYCAPPSGMPNYIRFCGQVWDVKYSKELMITCNEAGVTFPHERIIIVDYNQSRDSMADTLMHEVLHACLAAIYVHKLDRETEETLVRLLEVALMSVLRENPSWWNQASKRKKA